MTCNLLRCAIGLCFLVSVGAGSALAQTDAAAAATIAGVIAEHERTVPGDKWLPGKTSDSPPEVPELYQRGFARAWTMAGEGRVPAQVCGGFFNGAGVRFANPDTAADDLRDAMLIMDACYAGVLARVLSVRLGKVADANYGCLGEMTETNTHRQVVTSLLRDADPDGRLIAYLDGRLDTAIGDQVRATCPGHVAAIMLVPAPEARDKR